jgi:hypothetical protein
MMKMSLLEKSLFLSNVKCSLSLCYFWVLLKASTNVVKLDICVDPCAFIWFFALPDLDALSAGFDFLMFIVY